MRTHSRLLVSLSFVAFTGGIVVASSDARAASLIHDPHPPQYGVEIEPHLNLAFAGFIDEYRAFGWGPGVRFSIPVMSPGFIKSINDSIAISFGADLLHYDGYRYFCNGRGCLSAYDAPGLWAIYFPVTMQWNFWLSDKWSVFGEPGLVIRHAFVDNNYCNGDYYDCRNVTQLFPAFYGGARFHFGETTALTLRLGYPTALSVGLSFF